jgi:hypothetical protein
MEIHDRFKKIIFNKLASDLSHVEVIPYKESIWFIDRNDKNIYLEFQHSGKALLWKYQFFDVFFSAFSLEKKDYEPIIKEWVEKVLNRKVESTHDYSATRKSAAEEILNNTRKK